MATPEDETYRTVIRIPQHLAESIRESAEQNRRSLNAEIMVALEHYVSAELKQAKGEKR